MIDQSFTTDRDVGEFIEGARRPRRSSYSPDRQAPRRQQSNGSMPSSRYASDRYGEPKDALLSAIDGIEAQLRSLSGGASFEASYYDEPEDLRARHSRENPTPLRSGRSTTLTHPRTSRARHSGFSSMDDAAPSSGYSNALDRIQAQLMRVDRALNQPSYDGTGPRRPEGMSLASRHRNRQTGRQKGFHGLPHDLNSAGLNKAIRDIMERAESLNAEMAQSARSSVNAANEAMSKLASLDSRNDSLDILRQDIASLRHLLEEANFSGASEHVLNQIASLSGRIDSLAQTMRRTGQDPQLLDILRDIHALLDRPAQDPSIDNHFDRVLHKLDALSQDNYREDFNNLSRQIDDLRTMLSGTPREQHLTRMSGQLTHLADRLSSLEGNLQHYSEQIPTQTQDQSNLFEDRLVNLQRLVEKLNPDDRFGRLEEQLAHLADRLENGHRDMRNPIETLTSQVEALTGLVEQSEGTGHQSAFDELTLRISDLDKRIQENQRHLASVHDDHRIDQVEQTLARIDDMLSRQMETSNLSSLEGDIRRIADRMETHEPLAGPRGAHSDAALGQIEAQIAHLADRLDVASRNPAGSIDLDAITSRLDALADEFDRNQARFDAVDRLGEDVRRLSQHATQSEPAQKGPIVDSEKLAEQAALRALQQIGPLGHDHDNEMDVIIDGLKDDLHGLRKFTEARDDRTSASLDSVSNKLNVIVDRLSQLEQEVRKSEGPQIQPVANASIAESHRDKTERRGLGGLLRRRKAKDELPQSSGKPEMVENDSDSRPLSATELLANRKRAATGRGQDSGISARSAEQGNLAQNQSSQHVATASGAGKPGITLTSKSAGPVSSSTQSSSSVQTAEHSGQPQYHGNIALKSEPQPIPQRARIVDSGRGPAPVEEKSGQVSKADFIAAARRAAQAAAQESQRLEEEDSEAPKGFLARFKGSKKVNAETGKGTLPDETNGLNRHQRRAVIAEAKNKARSDKASIDTALERLPASISTDEATLAGEMLEDDRIRQSLFARIGMTVSRHSRPLMMAAAAILLAITTLQLVKNPESSLHDLFNPNAASNQGEVIMDIPAGPIDDEPMGSPALSDSGIGQSGSLSAPPSGQLGPRLDNDAANRSIAFGAPSGAQGIMAPRDPVQSQLAQNQLGPRIAPPDGNESPMPTSAMNNAPATTSLPLSPEMVDRMPTASIGQTGNNQVKTADAPGLGDASAVTGKPEIAPVIETSSANPLLDAAKDGDALAQFEMGRRLTLGQGMDVDLKKAADWFQKAAEQQMPQAQYSLGNLYEKGHGVKRDFHIARMWYERAADNGNVKAMHNLAVIYAEGKLGKPDFKSASTWFVKAADHGLRDSQYNLAILYARGMGVKQDLVQSYKWFAIGAKNGDKGAEVKRNEVLRVLTSTQQKTAKAIVAAHVPKVAKPSANKLSNLPEAWLIPPMQQDAKITTLDSREMVFKAQSMLGALGFSAGKADGQIGPRTRTAIRNFQQSAGLPITGKIDNALMKELSARLI